MANTKITSRVIADDAVLTANIADDAVTTANIADDAVTSAKLDTNIAIAGTLGVTGAVTADAGVSIDNITIDGTEIDLSSGSLTIDVAGNIRLDADDAGEVRFLDGGTHYGTIKKDGNNTLIQSIVADGDLHFMGIDGSSFVTPMKLDMSVGGQVVITNPTNHPMTVESTATNGGYIQFLTAANGANMGYIGSANELVNTGGNTDFGIRAQDEFYLSTGGTSARIKIHTDGTLRLGDGLESAVNQTSSNLLGIQFGFSFGNVAFQLGCGSYTSNYDLMRFYNGNGQVGDIRVSGSATDFDTSSDYRLKENVTYDWDATTRLKQLKPARFNWIADDTNTPVDGFLAHEVSDIVPNAINGEKDAVYTAKDEANGLGKEGEPNMQGIDHSKLVPLLVKAVQELSAEVEELKAKLESE